MSELVAAVDLGSNSFHLILGIWQNGDLRVLDRIKRRVQLAAGMSSDGRLAPDAVERALACLRQFSERIEGVSRVRVVGTSALRRASDLPEFLRAAEEALGHAVEVISGEEEGRLIYLGVAQVFGNDRRQRLVIDIGGGSTELAIGRQYVASLATSVPIGCVTLKDEFFDGAPHLGAAFDRAYVAVIQRLRNVVTKESMHGWRHVVGTSGTIESIRDVLQANGWCQDELTAAGVARLRDHVRACESPLEIGVAGLPLARIDILPAGLAILCAVFEVLDIQSMDFADASLQEGVLYAMLDFQSAESVLSRTVVGMQSRFLVDVAQAERVRAVGDALLAQVTAPWEMQERRLSRLLSWACALHEIGLAVSHMHHHRHSAYLIRHSTMPGFSRLDQHALAALLRGHRRQFPRMIFESLTPDERRPMMRLCVVLRLAYIWCIARGEVSLIPELSVRDSGATLVVAAPAQFLADHPLTASLLEAECEQLGRIDLDMVIEAS